MADSHFRLIAILKMLPRFPKMLSTNEIHQCLKDQGIETSQRTVLRDLEGLSLQFPIISDETVKPHQWGWESDADMVSIPGMDQHTALTFQMVEKFLSKMLPTSVLKRLQPHFHYAKTFLESIHKGNPWLDKIETLPRGQRLMPPKIKNEVLDCVYEALLSERALEISYQKRGHQTLKIYQIYPIGLVFRTEIAYLVGKKQNREIRQFALHRMVEAKLMEISRGMVSQSSLKAYIEQGHFGLSWKNEQIKIVVRLHRRVAEGVAETPLSPDQTLTKTETGDVLLKATAPNNAEIRWWLLSFGSFAEVLEPRELRKEFADEAKKLMQLYH